MLAGAGAEVVGVSRRGPLGQAAHASSASGRWVRSDVMELQASRGAGAVGVSRRGPLGQAAHATPAPGLWTRGATGVLACCRLHWGAGGFLGGEESLLPGCLVHGVGGEVSSAIMVVARSLGVVVVADERGRGRRRRAPPRLDCRQDLGGRGCEGGWAVGRHAAVGKRQAGVPAATVIVRRLRVGRAESVEVRHLDAGELVGEGRGVGERWAGGRRSSGGRRLAGDQVREERRDDEQGSGVGIAEGGRATRRSDMSVNGRREVDPSWVGHLTVKAQWRAEAGLPG